MGKRDARVDLYIAKSKDFAQPILIHLRELVHKAIPDVTETIKWGFPHFDYKGIVCSMASFKHHCAFGFWKASLMSDPKKLFSNVGESAMGHLGRITGVDDLPANRTLVQYIKVAAKLNEEGIKIVKKSNREVKKELEVPDYFLSQLKKNKKALSVFEGFSYSHKKEYVEWITEAKTEETKNKRMQTAIEWMAEGKQRMWKYIKK